MGNGTPTPEATAGRNQPVNPGPGPQPLSPPETQGGSTLEIGPAFAQTVDHFFPDFNAWLDQIKDPRFEPFIVYHKRFLIWYGIFLFACNLGSRRQLDYQLGQDETAHALNNLNRLANTNQKATPVHNTLNNFVGGVGPTAFGDLRTQMMNRLIRMKALDSARLQDHFVVGVDGSGLYTFREKHCDHCLTRTYGETTLYMHQIFEAKLLGPADMVLSIGSVSIDNQHLDPNHASFNAEAFKQDCELKALDRLAKQLRLDFPLLKICLSGDSLFGCGTGFQIAKDNKMSFIYVFKEGRIPTLYQDFQLLLEMDSGNRLERTTCEGIKQVYRWTQLDYTDSFGRRWRFMGIDLQETDKEGKITHWAWVTDLKVNKKTVAEVAEKGGRDRWHVENQGFNTQKNGGMNLEHAYSWKHWLAFYLLMQIAHILMQLLENGSLLLQLAKQAGQRSVRDWFGSQKNLWQRLRESLVYRTWPGRDELPRIRVRFNTS